MACMKDSLTPFSLLVVMVAGWLQRHQDDAIAYLREENRVLRELIPGKRLRLTNDHRRRLAVVGKALGRRLLREVATVVSPDTILAWHRKLVAKKHDHSSRRGPGRPRKPAEIRSLAVRMATENPGWGYTRIRDGIEKLGYTVGRTTVKNILLEHGIVPAPERSPRTRWRDFLRAHWGVLASTDFFTVDVWTPRGLVTYYVLFVVELATRRVEIAGITPQPGAAFMSQVARNLTGSEGFLTGKRYLIHDRDSKYTDQFRGIMRDSGVSPLKLPRRSPNLNAYAVRFVLSIKSECLNKLVLFGERSLRHACSEYLRHYHSERPHQGLGGEMITSAIERERSQRGHVQVKERVGGLLKYYYRDAA